MVKQYESLLFFLVITVTCSKHVVKVLGEGMHVSVDHHFLPEVVDLVFCS